MNKHLAIDPDAVFYHGTEAYFDRFEDSYRGSNTAWDNTVHGFFFADKKENALLFGDTIFTVNLSVHNPIDLRLHSIFDEKDQASIIWEILTGEKLDSAIALQNIYDEISLGEIGEMYDCLHSEDAHELMIEAGYDGIISSLGDDEVEYVVFSASQINILSIERPMSIGRSGR
ncbi:ADP-ribosyltransferase-containing protein [Sphingobacterium daejeonense]|uniref:ADP-ribosyltransferase-containing protein n=1 Tax=Sphingobacterium daejeonense TaxID=371142 RepID=UPI0010C47379|nr:hypothetical protein [Sphingobacterium daejeonense]VTP91304.1 Uncharacterised protein [Sphingobacterium daejeonense]